MAVLAGAGDGDMATLLKVFAVASLAMVYVRLAAASLRPGPVRLAAFAPVLAVLPLLPFSFSSASVRGNSSFFLVWLCGSKLLLLAAGRGPLADPGLPLFPFVFTALLPVKIAAAAGGSRSPARFRFAALTAFKAAAVVTVVYLYRFKNRIHPFLLIALYAAHIYIFMDLLFSAAAAAGRALGMELEPQFDKPLLASSLRDFWGRRWNLMVTAILRPTVYEPVRRRAGAPAGVLAAFAVSGIMHEVMFFYITLRAPDGTVTAFFLLHGACAVAEGWWARHQRWWRPPPALATPLVLGFVLATASWLFFPPLVRGGMDDKIMGEWMAALSLLDGGVAGEGRRVVN